MKDYTIYITKEIAEKVKVKGFPQHYPEYINYSYINGLEDKTYNVSPDTFDNDRVVCPTAEQICGWLDEQNIQVTVRFRGDCWYYDIMNGPIVKCVGDDVKTRKEALLEGINKALDLI